MGILRFLAVSGASFALGYGFKKMLDDMDESRDNTTARINNYGIKQYKSPIFDTSVGNKEGFKDNKEKYSMDNGKFSGMGAAIMSAAQSIFAQSQADTKNVNGQNNNHRNTNDPDLKVYSSNF
ncbi:hypothetical protein CQA53_00035 [Helicobacter didelphidarum]|uniref:Uncharacterized protein n=1 Tax=Helicobacter didelphidarum TaxID=2040648 RepID=A0A3D8IQ99_9HELI|nr:hypothetical protein [Helicobacter didelphidarum]RDU67458.1 hypothetical protein CQA53_00035 [Helicobacter didelphidarum]